MDVALILAVDTSATPVSCALLQEERVLASYYSHSGQTHSQTLMPMIEHMLQLSGVSVKQLDAVAVNVGPGSFTGVRIGVSTVKGLTFADEIPCIAVSTLEAMAEPLRFLPMEGMICCVMDARCQQVYTAAFSLDADGALSRLTPDEALPVEELKNRLKSQKKSVILVGDGSNMCYTMLKEDIPRLSLAPTPLRFQSAVGTALVARHKLAQGETVSAAALMPTYLRLPQAERELRARQAGGEAAQITQ